MYNRVTIENIFGMPIGESAALPPDQLVLLAAEAAEALKPARRVQDWLDGALDFKYGARACAVRATASKATGTVRFKDGDFVVIADLPTRVKWDQTRLAEAVEIIRRDWNDDPAVAEKAYGSWPAAIRRLEPARTVETGKPTYRIETAGKEAA